MSTRRPICRRNFSCISFFLVSTFSLSSFLTCHLHVTHFVLAMAFFPFQHYLTGKMFNSFLNEIFGKLLIVREITFSQQEVQNCVSFFYYCLVHLAKRKTMLLVAPRMSNLKMNTESKGANIRR